MATVLLLQVKVAWEGLGRGGGGGGGVWGFIHVRVSVVGWGVCEWVSYFSYFCCVFLLLLIIL